MIHANLRRSRGAALGVSLLAAAALLVPAAVAANTLPETVTVSWSLPVAPDVQLDAAGKLPSNFGAIFPQVYVAQVDGASLGSEDLLPQCGYVQEDVYLLKTQDDVDLLASLEANGLTLSNGKAGDHSIVQSWIFEYAGDCSTPTPSESASPSESATPTPCGCATPTPSESATPTPSESATPTPSESATPTPSGSAEASSGTPTPSGSAEASSGTPGVTPPATSTDGTSGGSGNGALLFVLALMALGTTGVLVLAPSPVSRRRRR